MCLISHNRSTFLDTATKQCTVDESALWLYKEPLLLRCSDIAILQLQAGGKEMFLNVSVRRKQKGA